MTISNTEKVQLLRNSAKQNARTPVANLLRVKFCRGAEGRQEQTEADKKYKRPGRSCPLSRAKYYSICGAIKAVCGKSTFQARQTLRGEIQNRIAGASIPDFNDTATHQDIVALVASSELAVR